MHVNRAPHTPGIALLKSGGGHLRDRVVPCPVIAGRHCDRAMLAAHEEITRCGREDLDPASFEDFQDVPGEGLQQPPVWLVGAEPADFPFQLVVEADQVGYDRIQDDASDPVTKQLILLVQAIDDRFPVCRTLIEPGELPFNFAQASAQLSQQHRNFRAHVRGRSRQFPWLGFFSASAGVRLAGGSR